MNHRLVMLLLVFAGLAASSIAISGGDQAPSATTSPVSHVVVVAMENHSRAQVIGSAQAPYLTNLAKTYGQATNYQNLSHPSLPNYLAVTGGSTAGVTNDCTPSSTCGSNGSSIFSQTLWKSYQESMPKPCYKASATPYAPKHNPAAYYRTLTNCATNDIPLPATPSTAAAFTFITPNQCHDMHSNTCSGSSCVVCQGDMWAKQWIPKLMATPEYKAGTEAIIIWWDENAGSGVLPFIVVSPYTHAATYTASINHYDLLWTIQSILGKPCIASSCGQTNFRAAFAI